MNSLQNRVQLIGNPGMDPEVRELDGGKKVAKFSIATRDFYKNSDGERVEDTQWHNVVAWGKTAELVGKFIRKGKQVYLEGKLTSRSYESKEGDKRYITEVVLNDILLLGRKDD